MIASLTGTLAHVGATGVVLDVGGVGYGVLCPSSSLASLPKAGQTVTLHTHLHVREDALTLYGFATAEERDIFEILIGVNGIGPKGALAILGSYTPEALRKAVLGEDLDALTLIPGVGRKTAARIILELKEKLGGAIGSAVGGAITGRAMTETRDALVALGYSTTEAIQALEAVAESNGHEPSTEQLLKKALQRLGVSR